MYLTMYNSKITTFPSSIRLSQPRHSAHSKIFGLWYLFTYSYGMHIAHALQTSKVNTVFFGDAVNIFACICVHLSSNMYIIMWWLVWHKHEFSFRVQWPYGHVGDLHHIMYHRIHRKLRSHFPTINTRKMKMITQLCNTWKSQPYANSVRQHIKCIIMAQTGKQ